MRAAVTEAVAFQRKLAVEEHDQSRKIIEDAGCEIVELTRRNMRLSSPPCSRCSTMRAAIMARRCSSWCRRFNGPERIRCNLKIYAAETTPLVRSSGHAFPDRRHPCHPHGPSRLPCADCRSASTARRSTRSISPSMAANSTRWSARTAPARPRRCAWWSGLLRPDAGSIAVDGIDALADPVAAKQITAWVSDEPMIYDKLTPLEYLEFVAGPLAHRRRNRRGARARTDRLAWPRAARARALRGFFQGHAAEGGAGRRAGARPQAHHPRRAAHRARRRLCAAGQERAARARRAPAAPSS